MKVVKALLVGLVIAALGLTPAVAGPTRTLKTFLGPEVTVPVDVPAPPAREPVALVLVSEALLVTIFADPATGEPAYAEVYALPFERTVAILWLGDGIAHEVGDEGLLAGRSPTGILVYVYPRASAAGSI